MVEVHEPRPRGVRVMTWNVHGAARPDLSELTRVIAATEAVVIGLQEIRAGQVAELARLLGVVDHRWLVKHRPFGRLGGRWSEGIATLSRVPITGYATADLSRSQPMRSFRRRVMQEVVVTTGAGPVRIVNAHLSSDDDTARAAQAARAVDLLTTPLAGVAGDRTVVLGDLNTDTADDVIGAFARAGLVDAWAAAGEGDGATNPAHSPTQRLDHVLTGRAFAVEAVRVIDDAVASGLSDHLPVIADLVVS